MIAKKRIVGLFPGSFNPLHIGHLALADYILSENHVDAIWMLPSPLNPLKTIADLLPYTERCRMIEEAIIGDPRMCLCDIECRLPQPNYTVRTLQALHTLYPEICFSLIIGADNWANIKRWYAYNRILLSFPLIIYPRAGRTVPLPDDLPARVCILSDAPRIDISSTQIREARKTGRDLRHWLPVAQNWSKLQYE